ncbi:MAG: CsbD family protein [Betaproteobacteria bacterium HGW-Betaproteobacteria-13]|uniref:General stress protein CsbD n=1 Tax=Parazoarcus communis TaxID=41977 RepID=A0A2U8H0V0_9RHOO|nr:CsbD family protein [Parazoarcus communis]AWI78335.1 general stress protein CsbD [Parazoarcus communis]PKO82321.1 MAG: CsbD family protein [Betaproteobacteria bacterium HGW-Betaproteobacteria-13]
MNKDQVAGRIEEAKGKAVEIAGRIVGKEELQQQGKVEQLGGKLRAGYGDLKQEVAKAISKA